MYVQNLVQNPTFPRPKITPFSPRPISRPSTELRSGPKSHAMNQEDFRKILATPRTVHGAAPSLLPHRQQKGTKGQPFKKPPPRIKREGRSDALEQSHVDLGSGYVDRAKERRLAELRGEAGEEEGVVKGLDF